MTLQEWFTDESKWKQVYGPAFNGDLRRDQAKCLSFAIDDLMPDMQSRNRVSDKIADTINPNWRKGAIGTPCSGWAIAVWNDAMDRTFADIQRVVKEANE